MVLRPFKLNSQFPRHVSLLGDFFPLSYAFYLQSALPDRLSEAHLKVNHLRRPL